MSSFSQFLTFLVTASIFAFIPGPAMLYAAAQTLARGRRSGFMASLGLHVGGYAHILASAFGLSLLLHAVPSLYLAIKLCGAIYLVWLGISLFRSGSQDLDSAPVDAGKSSFLQSVSVEVLNPKTAMFYLAFLPQFISPDAGIPVALQIVILGGIVNVMFSLADLVAVYLAGLVMTQIKQSNVVRCWLQRAGGTILVGLGVNLAVRNG